MGLLVCVVVVFFGGCGDFCGDFVLALWGGGLSFVGFVLFLKGGWGLMRIYWNGLGIEWEIE